MNKITAPYCSWKSPVSAETVAQAGVRMGLSASDGADVYWVETRPADKGRSVLVKRTPDGTRRDLTPAPLSVRSRVHEYGGGDYLVHDGTIFFSNDADQRLYRQDAGMQPDPLTPANGSRYADGVMDARRNRILCVVERERSGNEPLNALASVDAETGAVSILYAESDFVSSPRIGPDGSQIAWLAWNHPNMPWDGTELWTAECAPSGELTNQRRVAGGSDESIFQPTWSPDGTLTFASDRTGWWNLYRIENGAARNIAPMDAEFGLPQWGFGMRAYAYISADEVAAVYRQNGQSRLALINLTSGEAERIETPYTELSSPLAADGHLYLYAASPSRPAELIQIDLASREIETIRRPDETEADERYLSLPVEVEFSTENGLTARGFFYPPKNDEYAPLEGEKPPLIVSCHGGPTSAATASYNPAVQFFTSRGFAVLDVNYGGSAGYGRGYRERLNGQWGVVDVDDSVNGARAMAERGAVDGKRMAIRGGSAGGFTALAALAFRDVFKGGCSYYGIGDLEALAKDTHKFESRYLDRLIGPYPERADLYRERSPIHSAKNISGPVLFLQGMEDKVVPPNQTEAMLKTLNDNGLDAECVLFEGEGHGFRQAKNVRRALETELAFYRRLFGISVAPGG